MGTLPCVRSHQLPLWPAVSVSISTLYPGCENVSVRSRSLMFEPGLTKGTLEVLVAPSHHPHCSADDQSTKAIDIQNAYLNGKPCHPQGKGPHASLCWAVSPSPKGACAGGHLSQPQKDRGRAVQRDVGSDPGQKHGGLIPLQSKTQHPAVPRKHWAHSRHFIHDCQINF